MATLQFGALRAVAGRNGREGSVGAFALHLQAPWRLTQGEAFVVGSEDAHEPADPTVDRYDWDGGGPSRYDLQLGAWVARTSDDDRTVSAVTADAFGGFQLEFRCSALLAVFPVSTSLRPDVEEWRLLEPDSDTPHFVLLTGGRVENDV
jgi:hypothetical protein